MTNSSMRLRISVLLITAMILLTFFTGCMQAATYGGFSKDDQVTYAFRSGAVPLELNYYYTGRETMPYAIMGIDPSYTVPSQYWITFEPKPEQLRNMSSNIYGKDQYNPYGFNILTPDGSPIGIWFSNLDHASITVDQETRTVEVLYKNPESYRYY